MKITRKQIGIVSLSIIALVIVGVSGTAFAQELQYVPLAPLPGTEQATADLSSYLVALFRLVLGFAAVVAVVQITWGGFLMITAVDSESRYEEGKDRIKEAIYGLLLAMGAWTILYTVNPRVLDFNFDLDSATTTTQPQTQPNTNNPNPYNPRFLTPRGTLPDGAALPENFSQNPDNAWYKIQTCVKTDGTETRVTIVNAYSDDAFPSQNSASGVDGAAAACINLAPPVGNARPATGSLCSSIRYDCVRSSAQ